jgi:hypothetical protein
VALHLITLAFIESCGYEWHHRDVRARVGLATSMLLYPDVLAKEFDIWLPRLGLANEREMRRIGDALRAACEASGTPGPEARAARVHATIVKNKDDRGLEHEVPPLLSQADAAALAAEAAALAAQAAADPGANRDPAGAEIETPT